MKFIHIFFVFIYFPNSSFSQNCKDTSYRKLYNSLNASLVNYQYCIGKNDTAILAGNYFNTNTNDTAIYVIKLSPLSELVWAKKIYTSSKVFAFINGIIELDNGDIIINILSYDPNNSIYVFKLNRNGGLIWAKSVATGNDSSYISDHRMYIYQNELYACYMTETNFSNDFFSSSVVKMDTACNILWSKYYGKNYGCSASIPIAVTGSNNSLLVFGRMFPSSCKGSLVNATTESSYYGMDVNNQTGALVKSVSYRNPLDLGDHIGGVGGATNFFANITATDNGQFYLSAPEHYKQGSFKIRFDADLNTYDGSEYTVNNTFGYTKINVDVQGNTDLLYTDAYSYQDRDLYFGKFDANNNLIRQKRLATSVNTISNFGGFSPFAYKRNYMNLVTNEQVGATKYLQLYQLSNDEQNSTCYGTDTNFITIKTYPFKIDSSPFFDGAYDLPITVTNIPGVVVIPLIITEQDLCQQVSDCSSLKIIPTKDTVCDTAQNFIFNARKNATCYKHVTWQIDTTAISQMFSLNDTMVSIKFKKAWQGYLYAAINSCTDLKDSFKISVFQSPDSIALGRDTTICASSILKLNAGIGFKKYRWQDNSTNVAFTASQNGRYFVTATSYCGDVFSDTINVIIDTPETIHLGNDTSICSNEPLLLDAGKGFVSYQWNTASTTRTALAKTIGDHSVVAIDSMGCISKDTIRILNIYPAPAISLNKSATLCLGQNNILHAGKGHVSYLWQDGSADSDLVVTVPGSYKVTVGNNEHCFASDSVTIIKIATAPVDFLPADLAICSSELVTITATMPFYQYLWSNGSANSSISIQQPGIYWLRVKDNDLCVGSDTINIVAKDCATRFFIPNSFTPNNDGLNDTFKPLISGNIISYEFSIYNRYGQLVFKTTDVNSGWDGSFNDAPQSSAAFLWQCRYQAKNEQPAFTKGTVLLIR